MSDAAKPPDYERPDRHDEDRALCAIAAVAWPGERPENRDEWAVAMRHRPDMFAQTVEQARERLEAAIARGRAAVDRNSR